MNRRVFDVLEFDAIKRQIQSYCACSLGKGQLDALAPLSNREAAEAELSSVDEALQLLYRQGSLPFGGITDVRPQLAKAAIGGVLGGSELMAVADFIAGGRRIRQSVENAAESLNLVRLPEATSGLFDARQTEQEIRQTVDDDGSVFDHASPQLRRLRSERRSAEARVRQTLEQMLRTHQKFLQDPVIAMRGNSFCLPVRVEHKNHVPGIVHDYSSSGATVFIEPQAAVEAGLRVRELVVEEEREVERILQRVSGVVATVADELRSNADILANIDAWGAKAAYAKANRCERPTLHPNGAWNLRQARHPLLAVDIAVPMDLTIGERYRMVIITGPNTGGKTVALKTLGLLTLLAMSGCFITTGYPSVIGWCDEVFVDIGDEQSIEQSLSTFSSHMRTIVDMMNHVTRHSLALFDELGAGTDPAEGAALAIAILNHLNQLGCTVMATTHYAELKAYAFREPNAINASVEFDVETLRPTYRLQVGIPGRSNAFAIATRLGLDDAIVAKARESMHDSDVQVEDLIAQMERARNEAETLRAEAERDRAYANSLRADVEAEREVLEAEADKRRQRVEDEARQLLERAQSEAGRVIQELRRLQQTGGAKDHELVALRKSLEDAIPAGTQSKRSRGKSTDVPVGAVVRVLSLGQKGEVVERTPDGKELMVQLGLLRMKVKSSDVEVLQAASSPIQTVSTRRGLAKDIRLELDIRGETVEDAMPRIDKYLDDAVINGLPRVTIIHGKGTGALRDGVRRYLAQHHHVSTWAAGGAGEGGDGVTVVTVQ